VKNGKRAREHPRRSYFTTPAPNACESCIFSHAIPLLWIERDSSLWTAHAIGESPVIMRNEKSRVSKREMEKKAKLARLLLLLKDADPAKRADAAARLGKRSNQDAVRPLIVTGTHRRPLGN
jgi:hypothetical protein